MALPATVVEAAGSRSSAGERARRARKPGPTSRVFWLIAYGLTMVGVLLRLPALHETVRHRLQSSDMAGKVEDKSMEALAVNVGLLLAVFLTMLLLAVFYSLAAVVERNVLTMRRRAGRKRGFGLGYVIALLCTFPVHLASAVFGVSSPKTSGWYYLYVLLVAGIAPFLFRTAWNGPERRKIITTFAFAVGLAGLSLAV
ncbi:hypothetical protein ACFXEL_25420 [Streptomyces sp. NPDC059382]|uniref:hypothetical protein n=1 Tax=Streptomyces sp. NPDC059382 TaxID=3346816 RepID=UPI00369D11D5